MYSNLALSSIELAKPHDTSVVMLNNRRSLGSSRQVSSVGRSIPKRHISDSQFSSVFLSFEPVKDWIKWINCNNYASILDVDGELQDSCASCLTAAAEFSCQYRLCWHCIFRLSQPKINGEFGQWPIDVRLDAVYLYKSCDLVTILNIVTQCELRF